VGTRAAASLEERRSRFAREAAWRAGASCGDAPKEKRDVDRLEGWSLHAVFYTILGSSEEQLQKERQEYLGAKLRYDERWKALSAGEDEAREYTDRIAALGAVETDYNAAMQEKEALLSTGGGVGAARLMELTSILGDLRAEVKELSEALSSGRRAHTALESAKGALGSAGSWGTWDLLGGGLIATAMKHSRIDDAREHVHRAQASLGRFERELADLRVRADLNVGIAGFTRFADYFFDNLITDWIVQSRIRNSLDAVTATASKVGRIVDRLETDLSKKRRTLQDLERERLALLES
jgi:hypothetical protein